VEDGGAVKSVRRSAQLLRDTWGQQLVSGIRFGWHFLLFVIPGVILGAIGATYYPPVLALAFIYVVGLITVLAAAKSVFQVALYRYAAGSSNPDGWSPDALSSAFRRS
jgi:membrane protein YdbS with pleckstrin-like domain